MRKCKRINVTWVCILMVALILGACSGGNKEMSDVAEGGANSMSEAEYEEEGLVGEDYSSEDGAGADMEVAEGSESNGVIADEVVDEAALEDADNSGGAAPEAADRTATDPAVDYDKKIIKNARVEMEAKDSDQLYKELVNYGKSLGGYEFSHNIAVHENYSVINAVYKIPPDKLDQWLQYAGEKGTIINSNMSSEDITDAYYDAETRLESKEKSLNQYRALLLKADTIEDITYIQGIIDRITEDIEAHKGKLEMWNAQVDMATVEILIRGEEDPVKIKKEIHWNSLGVEDVGYLINRGLATMLNAIISVLQWILVAVVVTSPIWLIAGVAFLLWRAKRGKRRRRVKREEEDEN